MKGAATASIGTVPIATGTGTTNFAKIPITSFDGIVGDGGSSNRSFQTTGTNTLKLVPTWMGGTMAITNNSGNFTMTAASDATLNTNSDYVLFTGPGAPWNSENMSEITFNTDRLTFGVAGIYRFDFWCDIGAFPTNTSKVGFKFRTNGITFGPRKVSIKSNTAGDSGFLSAFAIVNIAANDYVQLMAASSGAGNLVVVSANFTATLIKAA